MTWSDFLKYSKYIAIFYAIAFVVTLVGIWSVGQGDTGWKFIWSGVLFGVAAGTANICLGVYHSNHRVAMTMEKNIYQATQDQAQVITTDGKELEQMKPGEADVEVRFREIARKAIRDERGY